MHKYFAQATPLVVMMAVFIHGFICAEDIVAEDTVSTSPRLETLVAEAAVGKNAPLFRHSTYPAAWSAAQKSNRPILVYVSMPNCPYCVKMMKKTYGRPEVGDLVASSFETVYAGRFTHAKLVQSLNVKLFPTTIIVGPNNKVLDVIKGYVDSRTFQRRLQTGLAAASSTQTR